MTRVIALYNTASKYDFISQRFAKETLRIGARHEYDTKRDGRAENIALLWSCSGLERYRQKTVFVVAPLADFNVLFGGGKEEINQLPDQREISRSLKESFQQGIEKGALVPVEQMSEASGSSQARSSLADLEVVFNNNTEFRTLYHVERNHNTGNMRSLAGSKRAMNDGGPNENSRRSKSSRQSQDALTNSRSLATHEPTAITSNPAKISRPDQASTSLHDARDLYKIPHDDVMLSQKSSRHENKTAHGSFMPSQKVAEEVASEEGVIQTKRRKKNTSRTSGHKVNTNLQEAKSSPEVPYEEVELSSSLFSYDNEVMYNFSVSSQRLAEEVASEEGVTETGRREKIKSRTSKGKVSTSKEAKNCQEVPYERAELSSDLSSHDNKDAYASSIPSQRVTGETVLEEISKVETEENQQRQSQGPKKSPRNHDKVLEAEIESLR